MSRSWRSLGRGCSIALLLSAGPAVLFSDGRAAPNGCPLPSQHAGVSFPMDHVKDAWSCRLEPIVNNSTTATKIGPVRTPLPQAMVLHFLDHPQMTAALVNRLDFGLYKAEPRGPEEFWATDGEGTEGVIHPLYRDGTTRMYFAEGSHDGRLLPRVTGKALVLLRLQSVRDNHGIESTDSLLVAYLRLDNRFLSGLLSLLRPLIGHVVNRQVLKAFDAARLLGGAMREHPEQVLFEATDPPPLPEQEVAFLKQAIAALRMDGQAPSAR